MFSREECWYQEGRCYGYFGLFQNLLRIPFVIILGHTVPELTTLFFSIAAGITFSHAKDGPDTRTTESVSNTPSGVTSHYL